MFATFRVVKVKQNQEHDQQKVLGLYDLLVDYTNDQLSDYLSISVSNDEKGTKISIKTIENPSTQYATTLEGIFASDLKSVLGVFNQSL